MDPVKIQYEAYPYPARDPQDEKKRLITGSPSNPVELDHFCFGGKRDWSKPFRVLVAGGGTGDALIQLAAILAANNVMADITYLDMSSASRAIAEERAKVRGFTNITFLTGDLLSADALAHKSGKFDYIDCCGVLHHLPDPQAGFDALANALADDGGMGLMVYAPYGRSGVYEMQDAFHALMSDADSPQKKVALAKEVLKKLPATNHFKNNDWLVDHEQSDAGLFDLLLHGRDRPYTVSQLIEAIEAAGLGLINFAEPGAYDPARLLPDGPEWKTRLAEMPTREQMALAERLASNMKLHIAYVAKADRATKAEAVMSAQTVPHLRGVPADALARQIAKRGELRVDVGGMKRRLVISKDAAPLIAMIDGRRSLAQIAQANRLDWFGFAAKFTPVWRELCAFNLMRASTLRTG